MRGAAAAAFATIAALLALLLPAPAHADTPAAGWREVDTAHFRFLFEPRDRTVVDELLTFAEDVYAKLTGFVGSTPPVVPVIIRGRFDEANAFTAGYPGRIEIYLVAATDNSLGTLADGWLKLVLTHELTHYVQQYIDTGLLHALGTVFGRDLSTDGLLYIPGWLLEGSAVYAETLFTNGGRGRSALFDQYTRAAVLDGSLFSLEQSGYLSAFPPPSRVYVGGWDLVSWLETRYGPDTLRQIMDRYLAFPFFGPWAAIKRVTGQDAGRVFADMKRDLVQRYTPRAAVKSATLVTPNAVGGWYHPQPTARGLVVYHTSPAAFPAIVRWEPGTTSVRTLLSVRLTDAASFSADPGGGRIVYSTVREDDTRPAEPRSSADLYELDTDTGVTRALTRNAHLWHPAVVPGSTRILAVQGARPYSRLVEVEPSTGAVRVLYSRAGGTVYTPAVSPDGATVAFVVGLGANQDVYVARLADLETGSRLVTDPGQPVIDINTGAAHPVPGPGPSGTYSPSFLDDHAVLFSSDRSGSLALYEAHLDSGSVFLVAEDPVGVTAGTVVGTTLLLSTWTSHGEGLRSLPVASLEEAPVTVDAEAAGDTGAAGLSSPAAPMQSASTVEGSAAPARTYVDLPLPYLWLPSVIITTTGPLGSDLALGAGATAMGGSLLGSAQWQAAAGWLPGLGQPAASLAVNGALGPVALSASASAAYGWNGSWAQTVQEIVAARWNIVDEWFLDTSRRAGISVGLAQTSALSSPTSFALAQSVAAPASAWSGVLAVTAGLDAAWQRLGGRADLVAPWSLRASLSGATLLPVESVSTARGEADLAVSASVPFPVPHQVVSFGLRAAQDVGGNGPFADSWTVPRGFPAARSRALPGGLLASVDWHASFGVLDVPLVMGAGITGAAVGVHVEGAADLDAAAGVLALLPTVWTGVDVSVQLSSSDLVLPLGVGIAARVDTAHPGTFDPLQDLGIYVFSGYDSLAASLAQRAQRSGVVQSMPTPMSDATFSMSASVW